MSDTRRRQFAYFGPDGQPVALGGQPMTRAMAVEAIRSLRTRGRITDDEIQLIEYNDRGDACDAGRVRTALPVPNDRGLSRSLLRFAGYDVPNDSDDGPAAA